MVSRLPDIPVPGNDLDMKDDLSYYPVSDLFQLYQQQRFLAWQNIDHISLDYFAENPVGCIQVLEELFHTIDQWTIWIDLVLKSNPLICEYGGCHHVPTHKKVYRWFEHHIGSIKKGDLNSDDPMMSEIVDSGIRVIRQMNKTIDLILQQITRPLREISSFLEKKEESWWNDYRTNNSIRNRLLNDLIFLENLSTNCSALDSTDILGIGGIKDAYEIHFGLDSASTLNRSFVSHKIQAFLRDKLDTYKLELRKLDSQNHDRIIRKLEEHFSSNGFRKIYSKLLYRVKIHRL